jgi:hypothetical protein
MKTLKNFGIMAIALVAFTLAFSNTTLANDEGGKKNVTELKFIGNLENQPVFQLSLDGAEEDEYSITFRDEYGNVLYADKVKGDNITKKFLLKGEEIGDATVNVVVRAKKTGKVEVYTINRSHSYVEETVVAKVK